MSERPCASLSLDLDNLWSYLRTHGSPGWEAWPSYLPTLVPVALETLDRHGLTITFFVVGRDADNPRDAAAIASIARAGHELGNHSYEHEPWLQTMDRARLEAEVERAERAIGAVAGTRPVGFRGPGYSWSPTLLRVLAERGYRYDASTLPALTGPLARAYYLRTSRLDRTERARRASLFGTWRDGLRPNRPYQWELGEAGRLLEIPVTTFPVARVPFHVSYLLYLAGVSHRAALGFFAAALAACRASGTEPSLLLHPLDFLGREDAPELHFFPGMDLPRARKLRLLDGVLNLLRENHRVVGMAAHATAILDRGGLKAVPVPERAAA